MARKLSQYKYYPLIRDYCMILLGALITGASYTYFFIPNNIAPGGITGIATVLNHLIGWPPVGTLSFILNIPLFLLALEWIGAMVTSMDPRRQNITPKMFTLVLWIAPVISIIGAAAIYPYNIGMKMNISLFGMLFGGKGWMRKTAGASAGKADPPAFQEEKSSRHKA